MVRVNYKKYKFSKRSKQKFLRYTEVGITVTLLILVYGIIECVGVQCLYGGRIGGEEER